MQEQALAWQPVPGIPSGQFQILERKADPYSSHAAVVRTPEAILVIDPGSAPDQVERLSQLLGETIGQARLPVLIVLTHLHWDHLAALPLLSLPAHVPVLVLAQQSAVAPLARGDRQASAAFLFNSECPQIAVTVPLLPSPARTSTSAWGDDRAPDLALEIVPDQVTLPSGQSLHCERLRLGGHDLARAFHTPGHSPDSICLQVGELLWVGDLFLAANPAVAGLQGWDSQALITSLETIEALLGTLPLSLCCPGHGRCLPAAKARQIGAAVRAQAETLRDIATLDTQRASLLIEYSEDLLSEGLALFTIMAGRLYTVSFHLEALEESATAAAVLQTLDIDGLDATLDDLRTFAAEFREHHRLELALPLKGVQTVGRIEKLFDSTRLHGLIDPLLLRRARRLLDDFMCAVRGIEPPATLRPAALLPVVTGVVETFTGSSHRADAQDLWDASGDDAAFSAALTRRLAAEAAAVRLPIDLDVAAELPLVNVDQARLEDTLQALLSDFAGAGAARVEIVARATPGGCRLDVRPLPDGPFPCFSPRKVRFLDRAMRLAGGNLTDALTSVSTLISLHLTAAPQPG
jgi:glyoxylase-like metal-dependent hydrolase (beta-lactamase superfamily II)